MRKAALIIIPLLMLGCGTSVTVKHDLRRTLPVIVDGTNMGDEKLRIGIAGKTGDDKGQTTEYYLTESVNETFGSYEKPNVYGYLGYSILPWLSVRAGLDDVGYCGDMVFGVHREPNNASGCLDLGLTYAANSSITGYSGSNPSYLRAGLGWSAAPFAFGPDTCANRKSSKFRIYGNLTWTQYPEWIDFSQSYNDSTGTTIATWEIKNLEKGETMIMAGGLSWDPSIFSIAVGFQRAFRTTEKGVRVDLGSQPPYLVDTSPVSETRYIFKLGLKL